MSFPRSHRGDMDRDTRDATILRHRAVKAAHDTIAEGSQTYWQTLMNKFTFTIPLQPQDRPVEVSDAFYTSLHEQYASMYLEALGVHPTAANIKLVLEELPMSSAQVQTMWKSRGALADTVFIQPHFEAALFAKTAEAEPPVTSSTSGGIPAYQIEKEDPLASLGPQRSLLFGGGRRTSHSVSAKSRLTWHVDAAVADVPGVELDMHVVIGSVKLPLRQLFYRYAYPYNQGKETDGKTMAGRMPTPDASSLLAQLKSDAAVQLCRPLQVAPAEISTMQTDIAKWFPVALIRTLPSSLHDRVRTLLSSSLITRLVGLLSHLGYWTVLRQGGDGIEFTAEDAVKIRKGILQTWAHLEMELQSYREASCVVRAYVLMCSRIALEVVLRNEYPLWFEYESLLASAMQLRSLPPTLSVLDRLERMVTDMVDPTLLASHTVLFHAFSDDAPAAGTSPVAARKTTKAADSTSTPSLTLTASTIEIERVDSVGDGLDAMLEIPGKALQSHGVGRNNRGKAPTAALGVPKPSIFIPGPSARRDGIARTRLAQATSALISSVIPDPMSSEVKAFRAAYKSPITSGDGSATPLPPVDDFVHRDDLRQLALWKVQNRYVQDRTAKSLDRLDILSSLEHIRASNFSPVTVTSSPPRLSVPPVPAAAESNPGAVPTDRPPSKSGSLRATGSKVVSDPLVRRKTADRDAEVVRIEQETLAFLDTIASQIHKYRSPFTTEDELPMPLRIRPAQPADSAALHMVCLQTGSAGDDATDEFRTDPDALGRLYTQPYLQYCPEFAFVLEDDDGVCGYTLAAFDTNAFNDKMVNEYLPIVKAKYSHPASSEGGMRPIPSSWTREEQMYAAYHDWKPDVPEIVLKLYPSHLHIDIIARAQGKGFGRKMIETQISALRASGSTGVYLGMSPKNLKAYGFYKKLGFHELGRADDDLWLGMRLTDSVCKALPPFCTGVIEGFYGRPWSAGQRKELVANMGNWGMNLYMYSPKDDRKHRAAWRELYSDLECSELSALIQSCSDNSVGFVYGIAPGLDMVHSSIDEQALLKAKLTQLFTLGVRKFAFLFDDISDALHPDDLKAFGTLASAQAAVANTCALLVLQALLEAGGRCEPSSCSLLFCPTEYCERLSVGGIHSSPYLAALGRELLPEIRMLWTGPAVISKAITVDHVKSVVDTVKRPLVIWDNLHANDYDNGRRLFLGPYSGREEGLVSCTFVEGILSNPNCEYEANFVPLRTLSLFAKAAASAEPYSPRLAYTTACAEWLERFNTDCTTESPLFSLDDVMLVGDMYYLPFELGERAAAYLQTSTAVITHRESAKLTEFQTESDAIQCVYVKLTSMHHRELCYTLYRYLWDAKEEADELSRFASWLHASSEADGTVGVGSPYAVPGPIRGGFVAATQRIVVFDNDTGLFRLPRCVV